jgi:hypothetical protein
VEAGADEALDSGGWVDALTLAPAALAPPDVAALLARCPSVQRLGARTGHNVTERHAVPSPMARLPCKCS